VNRFGCRRGLRPVYHSDPLGEEIAAVGGTCIKSVLCRIHTLVAVAVRDLFKQTFHSFDVHFEFETCLSKPKGREDGARAPPAGGEREGWDRPYVKVGPEVDISGNGKGLRS